eukprot:5159507-Prymnesium_polylepis.1
MLEVKCLAGQCSHKDEEGDLRFHQPRDEQRPAMEAQRIARGVVVEKRVFGVVGDEQVARLCEDGLGAVDMRVDGQIERLQRLRAELSQQRLAWIEWHLHVDDFAEGDMLSLAVGTDGLGGVNP